MGNGILSRGRYLLQTNGASMDFKKKLRQIHQSFLSSSSMSYSASSFSSANWSFVYCGRDGEDCAEHDVND